LILSACATSAEDDGTVEATLHSDRGGIGAVALAATVGPVPVLDPRRSLAVTDVAVLSHVTLAETLRALGAQSGQSADQLFRQMWDTENPAPGISGIAGPHCDGASNTLNGFPVPCRPTEGRQAAPGAARLDDYSPVGLFNRFDLAPLDGANCGEYRIVFARTSGGGRAFVIFEGVLPNPRREKGVEGCRPVADFWVGLGRDPSAMSRGEKLRSFYFDGLPGFSPVVLADNYGKNGGQVRLNLFMGGPWLLQEMKLLRPSGCSAPSCPVVFTPVTVKANPFGGLFSAASTDSRAPAFRSHFLTQVGSLARDSIETFNLEVPDRFNAGASDAQTFFAPDDYLRSFADNSPFRQAVAGELSRLGSPLSPEDIVARAQALSCAGCHQRSANAPLGSGLTFPASSSFVHATEFREPGPDGDRFALSSALVGSFLPFRARVLGTFLVADADGDGIADAADLCLGLANPGQTDSDGDGFGDECDGDFDQNGVVNALDLAIFERAFGTRSAVGDMNGDGTVNALDLVLFRRRFGKAPGPSARR